MKVTNSGDPTNKIGAAQDHFAEKSSAESADGVNSLMVDNKWPHHKAVDVDIVIGKLATQYEFTRATLIAANGNRHNVSAGTAENALLDAMNMLRSYALACKVVEEDQRQKDQVQRDTDVVTAWTRANEARFIELVAVTAERRAKELLSDLAKIQKNAKRRKARKGAMKGAKRG